MSIFLNYVVKAIQLLNCDTLKVHGKSPKYKYVDGIPTLPKVVIS